MVKDELKHVSILRTYTREEIEKETWGFVVVQACNPSAGEAEARGPAAPRHQPGLHYKTIKEPTKATAHRAHAYCCSRL